MSDPICYRPQQMIEFSECRSKVKFATQAEAQKANLSHRTYKCRFCDGWHLSSKPKKGGKK